MPRPYVRVVDRDPELAAALAAILRDAGHHALCGPATEDEPVDLLVVGAPIVVLKSAAAYGEIEAWTSGRPAYALLDKPIAPAALVRAVCALLPSVASRIARAARA
jgi:hypothetical protein